MSNYAYDPLAKGDKAKGQTKPGTTPPYQTGPGSFSASTRSSRSTTEQSRPAQVNVGKAVTNFFQDHPMSLTCTYCQETVVTDTQRVANRKTWCLCTTIFLLGGFLGCCLIPFCTDRFRDVEHRCSECHSVLGRYTPE